MQSPTTNLSLEQRAAIMKWVEERGIGVIRAQPKIKEVHTPGWQTLDLKSVDFRSNLAKGEYDEGIAVRTGKTLVDGRYLIVLDFDGWDSIAAWFCNWDNVIALSKKTLVEWHNDTRSSIHVFLFSSEPIITRKIQVNADSQLEVRCVNEEGTGTLIYVSPSIHKSGKAYEPLGIDSIETMQNIDLLRIKSKIDRLSNDYMSDVDKSAYDAMLDQSELTIGIHGGRHDATKFKVIRYYWKYSGEWLDLSDDERFERAWQWHLKHCKPPRSRKEFDSICEWVKKNHRVKRDTKHNEARDERARIKQQQEQQSPKATRFAMYPSATQMFLQNKKYTEIGIDPPKWIIADSEARMIYKAHQYDFETRDAKSDTSVKVYAVSKDSIVLKCIPVRITKHENPLEYFSKEVNYTMQFKDTIGKRFTLTRKTIEQVVNYLSNEGYIMPGYTSPDKLIGSVISMFREDEELVIDQSINMIGIYWIKNELVTVGLEPYLDHYFNGYLTNERKKDTIKCIDNLIGFFRKGLVSTALKIAVVAPFNFALKQNTNDIHWIPSLFTFGWPRTGKSSISSIEPGLYFPFMTQARKKPFASVNTEARLGHYVSLDTMPFHVFELKGLNSKKDPKVPTLLDMFKNIIETQEARSIMSNHSDQSTMYPALRHLSFSSNPPPPNDVAFRSRLIMKNFTHDDIHTEKQKKAFHEFIGLNIHKLRILGDFAIGYVCEHPDVLFKSSIKDVDWESSADQIITAFYESCGQSRPDWLDTPLKDSTEDEDYEIDEMNNVASSVRSVLLNYFNELYNKYARTLTKTITDSYGKEIDPTAHDVTLSQRVEFCITKDVTSHFRISDKGNLIILHSILEELEKGGVETDNVGSLKQLAQILDLKYDSLKVADKEKKVRCIYGPIRKLHKFLEGKEELKEV